MIKTYILNQSTQIEFMQNIIIIKKKYQIKMLNYPPLLLKRSNKKIMFIMELWLIKLFNSISIII